jgi:hypothetical protein
MWKEGIPMADPAVSAHTAPRTNAIAERLAPFRALGRDGWFTIMGWFDDMEEGLLWQVRLPDGTVVTMACADLIHEDQSA